MGWADGGAEVAVAVAILPGASGEVIPGGGLGVVFRVVSVLVCEETGRPARD